MTADLGPLPAADADLVALRPRVPARRQPAPRRQPDPRRQPAPGREPVPGGPRLLVVDPAADRPRLEAELAALGVTATIVASTLDGLVEFGRTGAAAVVVSPEARGVPATDFVRTIREHAPVFVIAALATADTAEAGPLLLSGASAAVTRPYSAQQLWTALGAAPHPLGGPEVLRFGPLELDVPAYAVRVEGERIADLPLKEFQMLRALMRRAPDVVTNEELRDALWGEGEGHGRASDNTLAVHATRLRHRLGGVAQIRRVRRRGYSLALA